MVNLVKKQFFAVKVENFAKLSTLKSTYAEASSFLPLFDTIFFSTKSLYVLHKEKEMKFMGGCKLSDFSFHSLNSFQKFSQCMQLVQEILIQIVNVYNINQKHDL